MLKIIDSLAEIDFRQLMDVYEETNRNSGKEHYPNYPENLQILYAEQDFYAYLEVFFQEPSARYAVWIADGCYAAALRLERYNDGLLLNALETVPALRNNGFARNLILSVLDNLRCRDNGVLYSHVKKNNAPSLSVHRSCGFRTHSNQAVYLDGTVRSDSYTLSVNY